MCRKKSCCVAHERIYAKRKWEDGRMGGWEDRRMAKRAYTITSGKILLLLHAKQPMENIRGQTPDGTH